MRIIAATIFLSAFLLFQIQPVIGKVLLPWFGGTPAVWTTCMLFFQALLLGGYAYAHGVALRMRPKRQAILHLGLLALAVVLLARSALDWGSPIVPGESWHPRDSEAPVVRILGLLTVSVGLPYLLLSSTGPLLQAWFTRLWPARSAYRLYALSNVGSLLGLLTYPLLVEPALGVSAQGWLWPACFLLYAVGAGTVAVVFARRQPEVPGVAKQAVSTGPAPCLSSRLLWIALAAAPSVLLLAVTNQISQEVAVVPFLWVLPLAIYLLSFVFTFESDRWYRRAVFVPALVLTSALACGAMWLGIGLGVVAQVAVWSALLFVASMLCHGELARLKPHPRHLTGFYLMVSIGGAVGGLLVGLVAPLVFDLHWELHASILGVWALAFIVLLRDPGSFLNRGWSRLARTGFAACALGLLGFLVVEAHLAVEPWTFVRRNFYGVLRVGEGFQDEPARYGLGLRHGRVTHGFQHRDAAKRRAPTLYFGVDTGVGRALRAQRASVGDRGLNVGVIGLGIGTLAAYGEAGDRMRFYEINPAVIDVALDSSLFTFLSDSPAGIENIEGDARLSLRRELLESGSHRFDLLVIDAFSSDSIPVHLVTREALGLYLEHLAPGGVLAFHITNRFLDLAPVMARLAEDAGLERALVAYEPEAEPEVLSSKSLWMLLSRDRAVLDRPEIAKAASRTPPAPSQDLWTDDFSNVLATLRLHPRD
ncbi:MAG TPA: ferrichrome ABC transporter permease [Myxococcales bacterium]|jgi:hypothetical protein|nr:ferrichrome ABC transporter permease [Myxococcales bacterium]